MLTCWGHWYSQMLPTNILAITANTAFILSLTESMDNNPDLGK